MVISAVSRALDDGFTNVSVADSIYITGVEVPGTIDEGVVVSLFGFGCDAGLSGVWAIFFSLWSVVHELSASFSWEKLFLLARSSRIWAIEVWTGRDSIFFPFVAGSVL